MFRAATVVTVFLIGLGIFHHPSQLDHELLCHPIIPPGSSLSGSLPSSASSTSKCAKWTAGFFKSGWLPLSFLKGKKLVVLGLGDHQQFGFWSFGATLSNLPSQPPWWPLGNLSMFSPVSPPSGRLPLLSITWEVHHRSNPSSAPQHNLGENGQGRKLLELVNALRGKCPSPTWFPYQPSVIGIVPDSAHLALLHCCSVHPKLSTHHPSLYMYQWSIPTLQDSLVRILLHRVIGCDSYTQHVDTQLNSTSTASLASSSLKMGRFIFMWASSQCCLPHLEYLDPSDWSELDDIKDVVDNELLLLLISQSGKGEGSQGDWGLTFPGSTGPMGWWWVVRTTISRCIFQRGTPRGIEPKGLLGQWIHTGMSGSSCLNSMIWYSLSNGPFTLLNCHCICGKVGWFSHPCTSSCEQECALSSLIHGQALPHWMSPIEKNFPTWACHHCFSESRSSIMQHICHKGAPNSSIKVTHISKQYFVLGQLDSSLQAGDQDGRWDGGLSNASSSHRSFALWVGTSVWPSIWRLALDVSSTRSFDLAAMDMKLVAVSWNSG